MKKNLTNELPLLEVARGIIVSRSGDYTIAFEMTKPEIFTNSAEDYTVMNQSLAKAIGSLPQGTLLHLQDWYRRQKYLPSAGGEDDFLATASDRHFYERSYLEHRAFLFITRLVGNKSPDNTRPFSPSALSTLAHTHLVPEETLSSEAIRQFEEAADRCIRICSATGHFQLRRLSGEDLAGNMEKPGIIEQYMMLSPPQAPFQLGDY